MLSDEYRYKILKRLETEPEVSQRELAKELGISLGKANYCLKALVERGLVKVNNFRNNQNKKAYIYFLTTKGVEEKSRITVQFLKSKIVEYETLKCEVEKLQYEAEQIQISKNGNGCNSEFEGRDPIIEPITSK
ncbi:MarR family EPS-associated transcriptional regulator [Sulfurirhabdus autotrophica]|uniref:EPS-associated MarR family transcriptional regulator n=1 Tax=Sulfurirhabdus autotrophica TaxID=1706046 RepID=A0A4R3XWX3_9PROT|nr:MarR family EPS-associated transcriptional regulator [Sulfurirhabdus autotrophica]TCV84255.1 EPS-associated MarR family transcriptional regulator [Sulfurirhabdus autotrophica]